MYDTSDLLYVHLDRRKRRRKFLVTTFLRALGYSTDEEIIKLFYTIADLKLKPDLDDEAIGTKVLIAKFATVRTPMSWSPVPLSRDPGGHPPVARSPDQDGQGHRHQGRRHDHQVSEEGSHPRYRRGAHGHLSPPRPGDPPTVTNAKALLKRLFFDPKRYDIGRVGRYKINQKLTINVALETRVITNEDIVGATQYVINLRRGEGSRTTSITWAAAACVRGRTSRQPMPHRSLPAQERLVKERMTLFDVNTEGMNAAKLINPKGALRGHPRFLRRSQLSQFNGPDQSARRVDAQASSLRAWARGSFARSRRIRSPRRASSTTDALPNRRRRKDRTLV